MLTSNSSITGQIIHKIIFNIVEKKSYVYIIIDNILIIRKGGSLWTKIFDVIIYILGLIMIFFILEIKKLSQENKQLETLKRIDVKLNPKITIYLEKFPYVIDGCGIYD